jgi:TatD DNase family protein
MTTKEEFYTVDFGVNYSKLSESEIDTIIKDSWTNGVDKICFISNSLKETKINNQLAKKFNICYTIGVHPHNAKQVTGDIEQFLKKFVNDPKCFAIGECGLDYNRMFSPKDVQKDVFRKQIEFAKKYNKKLYLHCRDAYDDFMEILREYEYYNGFIHVFYDSYERAKELTDLGFILGITGIIFDKRRNNLLIDTLKKIDLKFIVVETDAPFMSLNGKSVPSDTWNIIEEIARIRKESRDIVGSIIYKNSLRLLDQTISKNID